MRGAAGPLPEVLAPAGGAESLAAAVRCGADAVYLGGAGFNARRSAENFNGDALAQAVQYCHIRGVRVYLALNTLVFDDELPALRDALHTACAVGVDALIVQDLGVAALARRHAPDLPLHASTQMSVHDAAGAEALKELGFTRVVLARELSREEIAAVRRDSSMELECFVHGALCMCVSGQCYLSAAIGGRSGNRGMCAQPCRLPFAAGGREHVLSLRDLSLIGSAREIASLGVASLKIEGRMKRPEYVAAATTACRGALAGGAPDYAALEAVFSRGGFTSGYYEGARGPAMFGTRRKEDVQAAAPVLRELAGLYRDERQSVPVEMELRVTRGQPVTLTVTDPDGNTATATGAPPQEARTAPTDAGRAAAALGKTGGTPYTASNIQSKIDDGLMVPASALNALRRQALDGLSGLRARPRRCRWQPGPSLERPPRLPMPGPPRLRARLSHPRQLTPELLCLADEVTLPALQLAALSDEHAKALHGRLLVEIPGIVFDGGEKLDRILQRVSERGVRGAVTGGLSGISRARRHGLAVHGDYGLNIANTPALQQAADLGLADATLSLEMDLRRIRALGGPAPHREFPVGILAYGYLPLMVTRNCPAAQGEPREADACARCGASFPAVTDRMGNRFFVGCDWGVPRLHNCVPLVLSDRLGELGDVDFLTLYFTRETPQECARVASLYRDGGTWDGPKTRGLLYRRIG